MNKNVLLDKIEEVENEIEEMNADQMFDYFRDPFRWRERMAFLLLKRNALEEIERSA